MKINYLFKTALFLLLFNLNIDSVKAGLFDRPDFFEKGYEQFEEEIRRFERGESVLNPSLNTENLPWSRIISEKSGFTLTMPPGNITQEIEIVEAPEGDIQFDIIASHPSASRYVIAYSEEVSPERFQNTQAILSKATNSIAKNNVGLEKIAEKDITLDNNPGKEFQLKNQEEIMFFRLILVEQRLYVLAVNQQNDSISEELVEQFFDSFELID